MCRNRRLWPGLAACVLATLISGCDEGPTGPRSVILVTLDTTRADRIGAYGGTAVPTPHLDRVAREGVLFEEAISQVPLTLPSHSSIFTGRYPGTHGVRHNGIYHLPDGEQTLAEHLDELGFTAAGFVGAYVLNRGFGVEQGFSTYDEVPVNRFAGGEDQLFSAERSAAEVNAAVFEWLDGVGDDERVFLWVHYYDPHDPYEPPEVEGRELRGEGYDREISYVDHCLGELLERLEAGGRLDRSVLVVVGDHGESLGEHDEITHGIFLYESAVRVPFLVRAPGLIPRGTRVDGPVELVDVAPTVLDLLDLSPLAEAQGRSLVERIEGREDGLDAVAYAESLMPKIEFGWSPLHMVRDARFKYVEAPRPELYDLRVDPDELNNLAPNDPERAAEMAAELKRWQASTSDAEAETAAQQTLDPNQEALLRSLGYLGDGTTGSGSGEALPDPKDQIAELRRLDELRDRFDRGESAEILEPLQAMLADNPANHRARSTLVRALIEVGQLDEAEIEAKAYIATAEADPDASTVLRERGRLLLASVYRLQGKWGEAEQGFRAILAANPGNEAAAVDLARMFHERGRADEAETLIAETLDRNPRNGGALAVRFLIERQRGDEAAALLTARRLAEERAGEPPIWRHASSLLLEAGEPGPAAVLLGLLLEQTRPTPELLGRLGSAELQAGQLDDARRSFLAAAGLVPRDPRPQHFLALIALAEDNEDDLRFRLRQVLALDPSFTATLVGYARWLDEQGRRDDAAEAIADALRRNPADERARELAAEWESR